MRQLRACLLLHTHVQVGERERERREKERNRQKKEEDEGCAGGDAGRGKMSRIRLLFVFSSFFDKTKLDGFKLGASS